MTKNRNKSGFFSLLSFGIITTVAGGCIIYFFGNNIELTLTRAESESTIVRTSIMGESEIMESFGLDIVHMAILQENRDSDGDKTYRVALETDEGPIPLASYYSSGRKGHQKKIDTINDFINGTETELHVKQSALLIRLAGFLFLSIGILMLLSALGLFIKLILALVFVATKS